MEVRKDALGNREITALSSAVTRYEGTPPSQRKLRLRPPWGGDDTPWTVQILGPGDEIFAGMWIDKAELVALLREAERNEP